MKKRLTGTIALLLMVSLCTGALFAGGGQENTAGADADSRLVIWTAEGLDNFVNPILTPLAEKFEAAHPGVEVVIEAKPLEDLKLTTKIALTSDDAPDIIQINQGVGEMGLYSESGLLVDLTDFANQSGWDARVGSANLHAASYPADEYYGISTGIEIVGCFYNKAIFDELGLAVPTTFSELQRMLPRIKAAGYTPFAFGNLDGWPGIHYYSAIQHVLVTRSELDDMMSGNPGDYWLNPGNVKAAQITQEWVEKGYFTEQFSGIGYDDTLTVFNQGESAMWITGNWMSVELSNSPFEVGFFPFPADDAKKLKAIGGVSLPYCIAANSDNIDTAKEFLNSMTTKEFGTTLAEANYIPLINIDVFDVKGTSPLFTDLLLASNKINAANGIGWYIDWVTPTFYDTVTVALQLLMTDSITPDEFVAMLQDDYNENID